MAERSTYQQRVEAGGWLRHAREDAGLSIQQLADRAQVTKQQVSNWELGRSRLPEGRCVDVATALGVDVWDVRRVWGYYVPPEADDARPDVLAAIRADRRLLPEARQHLLNQYELLLRLNRDPARDLEHARDVAALEQERRDLRSVDGSPRRRRQTDLE